MLVCRRLKTGFRACKYEGECFTSISLNLSQLGLIVPKSHFLSYSHGWKGMMWWRQFQTSTSQMSIAIWTQSWKGKYDEFGGNRYEWVRKQFEPGCQEEQGTNEGKSFRENSLWLEIRIPEIFWLYLVSAKWPWRSYLFCLGVCMCMCVTKFEFRYLSLQFLTASDFWEKNYWAILYYQIIILCKSVKESALQFYLLIWIEGNHRCFTSFLRQSNRL